jgi:predicted TIM-barrel fold metal-dependent hydrolase
VCPTPLADYVALARAHPAATFILAHLGGGLPFYAAHRPAHRETLRNVYYDTAALPLLYDPAILRQVIDLVGPDRLLYGSDYPLCLYPRTHPEPDFVPFLAALTAANLTLAELDALLSDNARRLLRLT